MSKSNHPMCLAGGSSSRRSRIDVRWVSGLAILALLMAWRPVRADDPGDLYQRMYALIQQGDSLDAGGQTSAALDKYREAQTVVQRLKQEEPQWNKDAVAYRSNYLAEKIAALTEKAARPAAGGSSPDSQPGQPEAKPPAAASTHAAKLLEAGTEPRQVLRLHPQLGDKQTVSLTLKIGLDLRIGQTPSQAMNMPSIQMSMDTTVKSVSPEGDILYDVVMGNASVAEEADANPQIAQVLKSAFSGFKGLPGSGAVSDRGFTKGIEMKAPAGTDPQLRQAVGQMSESFARLFVPVPEEAVGPGARWEVKMPVKSGDMTIDQTAAYQLVSLEGNRVTVKDTVQQEASNQKIHNPAMPSLMVDLKKMSGKGGGDVAFDLTRLLPREGTSLFVSESVMEVDMGGQKNAMTVKTTANVRLEGK